MFVTEFNWSKFVRIINIRYIFIIFQDFVTNSRFADDVFKDRLYGAGVLFQRGDSLGGFELGSSLVLVFTAPKDFEFNIKVGQRLRYGEPIGSVVSERGSK